MLAAAPDTACCERRRGPRLAQEPRYLCVERGDVAGVQQYATAEVDVGRHRDAASMVRAFAPGGLLFVFVALSTTAAAAGIIWGRLFPQGASLALAPHNGDKLAASSRDRDKLEFDISAS